MEDELKIVRGNDFYLRVLLRMKYVSEDMYGHRVISEKDCPLDEATELRVFVVNSDGCRIEVPYAIQGSSHHVLVLHVKHHLCCGRYGIEVVCIIDGRQIRCYEKRCFRIVEDDGKSYLSLATFEGGQEYVLTMKMMLWAAPSYPELHLELNGMRLVMTGTVDNGEMRLDDQGRLVLVYN